MSNRDIYRLKAKSSFRLEELAEYLGARVAGVPSEQALKSPLSFSSLCDHSRYVQAGDLFIAYEGEVLDGHEYVPFAFEAGAAAAVVEKEESLQGHPGLVVGSGRFALSALADLFAGHPSRELKIIGVTGTNGKTTVHWILHHTLNRLQLSNMRIGTLGVRAQGLIDRKAMVTTPSSLEIHSHLSDARDAGLQAAVLESSSHALDQLRVEHVDYDVGVFTNLTPDHLHYHGDMESYFNAKLKLFRFLSERGKGGGAVIAVVNRDDDYGRRLESLLINELRVPKLTFGEDEQSDVRIVSFDQGLRENVVRLLFQGREHEITCPYIGAHNASNMAAAFATALALEYEPKDVVSAMQGLPSVPGRLEFFGSEQKVVYVDYAHTADALSHALRTVRPLVKNRLWVLFGAGGDKDPRKRQGMGKIAAELADCIVLTSDNPKKTDPMEIIREIQEVCEADIVEVERGAALEKTIRSLADGDVLVVAGKGHEDYQIIGDEQFHFSDREEVLRHHRAGLF